MKNLTKLGLLIATLALLTGLIPLAHAQGFEPERVFKVKVFADQEPAVAGETLNLAVEVRIDQGWHINSDNPGDEFSIPTTLTWTMPEGWPEPEISYPEGEKIKFEFSDDPLEVWEGRIYILAKVKVPDGVEGVRLRAEVTAQACNNTQCLPPTPVRSGVDVTTASAGTAKSVINEEIFAKSAILKTSTTEKAHSGKATTEKASPNLWIGIMLVIIGSFVLIALRLGHQKPLSDRLTRFICLALIVGGALLILGTMHQDKTHLEWSDFDDATAQSAIDDNQTVILDFAADWCLPCRELDERTFSDPSVAKILTTYTRFKANLTKETEETEAWTEKYDVRGVPTIIVFEDGEESFRITGFEGPEIFIKRLGGEVSDDKVEERLASTGLPLQILLVFLAGLALNLTPCIYPLIPITIGFFSQQAKDHPGGTFGLAIAYVLGISVTYSVLGVAAALGGQILGSLLQSPIVIGLIVIVLLALALSMFGLWEFGVPGWATKVSGGRGGYLGSLLMGLMVGVVAAPCIGPFVLGLVTYVGQRGNPLLGFILFFSLSMGLGLPYLLLGTFAGAVNKMPASGMWMIGVRKIFGILLVALAAYFGAPLLPPAIANWIMATILVVGGAYLLLVERTGHDNVPIDRAMRIVSTLLVLAGIVKVM